MQHFSSHQRKDDIVVIVHQDNTNKKILIENCNTNITNILGHTKEDLIGADISKVFAAETLKFINDHVSYDHPRHDIVFTLSKIRYCKINTSDNTIIEAKIKAFATYDNNNNTSCEILLRTFSLIDKLDKFREQHINHDNIHFIPELKIYDRDSIIQELTTIKRFHSIHGGCSLVGYINISNKANIGLQQLKSIIAAYHSCTRKHDLIGYSSRNTLIFAILDYSEQYKESIVNRISDSIHQVLGDNSLFVIHCGDLLHSEVLTHITLANLK